MDLKAMLAANIGAPLLASLLILWAIALTHEIAALAQYARLLEHRINERVGEPVLLWERIAQVRAAPLPGVFVILAIVLVGGWAYGTWNAWHNVSQAAGLASAAIAVVVFLLVAWSAFELAQASQRFAVLTETAESSERRRLLAGSKEAA